jgi:hypothetical protein
VLPEKVLLWQEGCGEIGFPVATVWGDIPAFDVR